MEAKKMKCAVLGGDIRQIRLCRLLAEEGWQVGAFGLGQEELEPGAVRPWRSDEAAAAMAPGIISEYVQTSPDVFEPGLWDGWIHILPVLSVV